MALTATLNPSNLGLGGQGGITSEDNIVFTYKMAASASLSKGDFVKLSDSTNGYVSKCTATSDSCIGVAQVSVNNTYKADGVTAGAAGDKYVPVIVQGIVEIDAVVTASAVMNATIFHNQALYLNHAVTTPAVTAGHALTSTNTGGVVVGAALDSVPIPTTTALYRMRVFIDRLNDIVN